MQIEAKNCPFCGGQPIIHNCAELENETAALFYNGKVGVHCKNCGVATLPFEYEYMAINAWNRRVNNDNQYGKVGR